MYYVIFLEKFNKFIYLNIFLVFLYDNYDDIKLYYKSDLN